MSQFRRDIPLHEIQPGDHFMAKIPATFSKKDKRAYPRRCQLVEICGKSILRVKTATRRDVLAIARGDITSEFAWGDR